MSSISPFLLSLTTADVFVWQFQVIVTRAENAITFSHYDYATSNGHELAVALSLVKGIDEPSNKMPASEPGIGAFEGWFAVEADRRAGHPFDVMISL